MDNIFGPPVRGKHLKYRDSNIAELLSRLNATINDFSRYFLPPFKRPEAKALLSELAASYGLSWYKGVFIEKTLDLIGDYYPFFLHGFFQELRTRGSEENPNIEGIFENNFIPSIQRGFFDQFLNRLKSNYSDNERKSAYCVLDFISRQEEYIAGYSAIRAEVEKHLYKQQSGLNFVEEYL